VNDDWITSRDLALAVALIVIGGGLLLWYLK